MTYDIVSEGMGIVVKFMKKVFEKDPKGNLITLKKITLNSKESTGDFK